MPRLSAVKVFLLILALVAGISAQTYRGRILGTVSDSSGAAIAGAKVTLVNKGTGATRTISTNEAGDYVAPNLDPGTYSVAFEAPNFKKLEHTAVTVEVAKDVRLDEKLQAGGIDETVTVNAEPPAIETTNDVLGGTFSNRQINDLPLQGRDFQNLVILRPGIQRLPGGGFLSITSNGNRPEDNNFIVDGTDDNDAYYGTTVINAEGVQGTPATHLPIDAIQEFNTMQNPASEYGWKPGAVVNVGLKGGSNDLHGTAYYFHRNSAFDARNFFNTKDQPASALRLHEYGASVGGPIVKDKLFIFGAYEGVRDIVGNPGNVFSPVTDSIGDPSLSLPDAFAACGATCNPLSVIVAKLFPVNHGTADPNDPSAVNLDLNNTNREDNVVAKTDYHLSNHNTVSGRYFYGSSDQLEEDINVLRPEFLSRAKTRVQVTGMNWTWTPNDRWVNEVRFGYNRFWQTLNSADATTDFAKTSGINTGAIDPGFPEIRIGSFSRFGGNGAWPLFTIPNQTMQISDNVSWLHGNHNLRFGGEFRHGGTDNARDRTGRGRIDFRSLTNFANGKVRRGRIFLGNSQRHVTLTSFGGFVQDDWKVTPHITLNLGMRYDLSLPIKESHDLLANFDPTSGIQQVGKGIKSPYNTDGNNFAPRFGIAWDLFGTGKTVLRAGGGITYEIPHISVFIGQNGTSNASTSGLATIPAGAVGIGTGNIIATVKSLGASDINWSTTGTLFDTSALTVTCDASSPCDILGVSRNLKTPYVETWNLNLQQAVTNTMSLQVGYVGNKGNKLYSVRDINQPTNGVYPLANSFPYLGYVNFLENRDNSIYHGLQTTLTQHSYKGLDFVAGYTWSHSIDVASGNRSSNPQDSFNVSGDRGNSDTDIRHRFTFASTYNLPSKEGWGQMLKGWQMNNIVTLQSGSSMGFFDDTNDISGSGEFNDRWDFFGDPHDIKWTRFGGIPFFDYSSPTQTNAACDAHASQAQLLTYGCFAQGNSVIVPQEPGTFGNMRRNMFRGPAYANWDLSLTKNFQFTERVGIQLRGEFFNVLNHPNFSNIDTDLADTGSLGKSQFTPDVGASNPVVGSGGSRHIQVGAKIRW